MEEKELVKGKIQRCVRVYPEGWNITYDNLNSYLDEGWTVVIVTVLKNNKDEQYADYIIEKKVD